MTGSSYTISLIYVNTFFIPYQITHYYKYIFIESIYYYNHCHFFQFLGKL